MTDALCTASELRMLANIAFMATKMKWQDEAETIYRGLAGTVQTKAELYFAWLTARCEFGDLDGARELMGRLESLPNVTPGMVLMARCYLQCCSDMPEWMDSARRVVGAGPEAFGYETAKAMLIEHDLRRTR